MSIPFREALFPLGKAFTVDGEADLGPVLETENGEFSVRKTGKLNLAKSRIFGIYIKRSKFRKFLTKI